MDIVIQQLSNCVPPPPSTTPLLVVVVVVVLRIIIIIIKYCVRMCMPRTCFLRFYGSMCACTDRPTLRFRLRE